MRSPATLFTSIVLSGSLMAQAAGQVSRHIADLRSAGVPFTPARLLASPRTALPAACRAALDHGTVLQLDASRTAQLLAERPATLALPLPTEEGELVLDLERVDITTADFSVVAAGTNAPVDVTPGLHYRGAVRGEERSLAAISVFGDEVMGMIADEHGDHMLGRLKGEAPGTHLLYRTADAREPLELTCGTPDDGPGYTEAELTAVPGARSVHCVRFYWEVDHDIFLDKGSVAATTNYVTGLFNESATLFANEGVTVSLLQVFVWDVPSPYTGPTTIDMLNQFRNYRTSFVGDLAHLLGYRSGGGYSGYASIDGLCRSRPSFRMAYSRISSSYSPLPTYSSSVYIVTHEQGHLLGSRHTHACVWNGDNTAIDGCAAPEGSCPRGPIPPPGTGTIMSYCGGISLLNGFGPQPRAVILGRVENGWCLSEDCGPPSCAVTPVGLQASNITPTSALLTWLELGTGTPHIFQLQWKAVTSSTWATVSDLTSSSYALMGLLPNTSYHFRVKADCIATSSPYTDPKVFTTLPDPCGGPPGGLAVTGITAGGEADLSWNANSLGSAASTFTLTWGPAFGSGWVIITGLTTDHYHLSGLEPGIRYGFRVRRECAAGISTYSPMVTFYGGYPCGGAIGRMAVDSITSTSAALHWREELTASSFTFTLQWRQAGSWLLWHTVTGLTTHDYTLTGLSACTDYVFRVRMECALGPSAYTDPVPFTTFGFCTSAFASSDAGPGMLADRSLQVFPNPAGTEVNVVVPASEEPGTLDLLDAMGRVVERLTTAPAVAPRTVGLDVGTQAAGIYLVRLTRPGDQRQQQLVVTRGL